MVDNFSGAVFQKRGGKVFTHYPHFNYRSNKNENIWTEFAENYNGTTGNLPANLRSRFNAKFGQGSFKRYMAGKKSWSSNKMAKGAVRRKPGQPPNAKAEAEAARAKRKEASDARAAEARHRLLTAKRSGMRQRQPVNYAAMNNNGTAPNKVGQPRAGAAAPKKVGRRRAGAAAPNAAAAPRAAFLGSGTKVERNDKSKIIHLLGAVIQQAHGVNAGAAGAAGVSQIPKHILNQAHELRLLTPAQISSYSGGNLENESVRAGAAVYGTPVVDFRKGPHEKDRDTGNNPLNIFFNEYVPQEVMPWHDLSGYTLRTKPTYFIKCRFSQNPLNFFCGIMTPKYPKVLQGNNKTNRKGRIWDREDIKRGFALMATQHPNTMPSSNSNYPNLGLATLFRLILNYADGKYEGVSKGSNFWEKDLGYYDPITGQFRGIELKIEEGKSETFPAEAIQLARGKMLIHLWTPLSRIPGGVKVSTWFIAWGYGQNRPPPGQSSRVNYRNWREAARGAGAENYEAIKKLANRIVSIDPNFNTKIVNNNRSKKPNGTRYNLRNALPGLDIGSMTAVLHGRRAGHFSQAAKFSKWIKDTLVIRAFLLGGTNALKAANFTSFTEISGIVRDRARLVLAKWFQGMDRRRLATLDRGSNLINNFLVAQGMFYRNGVAVGPANAAQWGDIWSPGGVAERNVNTSIRGENWPNTNNKDSLPPDIRILKQIMDRIFPGRNSGVQAILNLLSSGAGNLENVNSGPRLARTPQQIVEEVAAANRKTFAAAYTGFLNQHVNLEPMLRNRLAALAATNTTGNVVYKQGLKNVMNARRVEAMKEE